MEDSITHDPTVATPPFPLADPKPAELSYWDELWDKHPLNAWWIERGVVRELALFVRITILAESKPSAPLLAQVRGARSDLGLSAVGAKNLGLKYSIGDGDEAGEWWE
ncbi:hypothetical protein [Pseudonocardia sp. WMMC193]|uniref:hypothetical protein n=1 Tax=Pseudonocardia sp. WMMC193 TaxID=2911965 RepID=UPI001F3A7C8E|nr:hypothetical protein [Pseudonocardia sp. WMMC193]MCF7548162.1 hypothetical protein [Pseudonocardia sp. WMMC193]